MNTNSDSTFSVGLANANGRWIIACGMVDANKKIWLSHRDVTDDALGAVRDYMLKQLEAFPDRNSVQTSWTRIDNDHIITLEVRKQKLEEAL